MFVKTSLTIIFCFMLIVYNTRSVQAQWAFEETFDGNPSSPSQNQLPPEFDFVVTHRTHDKEHFSRVFSPFPADHAMDCAGPDPINSAGDTTNQHQVQTSHHTNGTTIDKSFFICKDHMMSSMGDVSGYSVTSFWPRQDFDFADGGTLEWDVNINDYIGRSWYEVMIMPRSELKVGSAIEWLPIDEHYPKDRIVLRYGLLSGDGKRSIGVGTGAIDPQGWLVDDHDWREWKDSYPNDPANTDRRIRRKNRVIIENNKITWSIQKQDGSFDSFSANVPGGLPFKRGLVMFKTHAYTPAKEDTRNMDRYTFHWDNIRFDGPVVGKYDMYEAQATDVAYLQANGDRDIGENETIEINLPNNLSGRNPVLFGQVSNPIKGQVLLSVNGGPNAQVEPYDYDYGNCFSNGWKSFRYVLDSSKLKSGTNTFKWTIGNRANCPESDWASDGFSIKNLEVQADVTSGGGGGGGTSVPGDYDGDRDVDYKDFLAFISYLASGSSNADLDQNSRVNIFDFSTMVSKFAN